MKRLLFLILALCLSSPAWAAISLLQSKECEAVGGGMSQTCTYTSSNTNPSELIAIERWGSGSQPVIAASDPTNGSWACAQLNDTTNGRWMGLCHVANTASSALTVTCSNGSVTDTSAIGCDIAEYSGLADTIDNALVGVCSTAATTSPSSGNITTANANDLILGLFTISTSNTTMTTVTEDSNFTQKANDTFGVTTHDHLHWGQRIVSATETRTYNPMLNASVTVCIGIASIKASGGGGGPVCQGLMTRGIGCK